MPTMQKRRPGGSGPPNMMLPLSEQDLRLKDQRRKMMRRKKGSGSYDGSNSGDLWSLGKLLMAILSLGLGVVVIQQLVVKRRHHGSKGKGNLSAAAAAFSHRRGDELHQQHPHEGAALYGGDSGQDNEDEEEDYVHPLHKFQSLRYPLKHAQLVVIYFGASWCPICAPVSRILDEHFNDLLLPPPPVDNNNNNNNNNTPKQDAGRNLMSDGGNEGSDNKNKGGDGENDGAHGQPVDGGAQEPQQNQQQKRHGLALVYVSSDRNEEEMDAYLENRNWFTVPYASKERSDLKRHFKTCAKVELEGLGFERRHEIPTLIIVDGISQQVLTFTGVKDVQTDGVKAIETWHKLQSLSHALDAKFDHTDDIVAPI